MIEYEVDFSEDEIQLDANGKIKHHPLNGLYTSYARSSGYLTFCGDGMDKSRILDDVRVFHLEFFGEPDNGQTDPYADDREAWADPIRIKALQNLLRDNLCWYISFVGYSSESILVNGYLQTSQNLESGILSDVQLAYVSVRSKTTYGDQIERVFFEIPNKLLSDTVITFWEMAVPGISIEGYLMPSGQIEKLELWNKQLKDDRLFREVMDTTRIAFYTFPSENRYLVFLTNKMTFTEMESVLKIETMKKEAVALGNTRQAKKNV